MNEALQKAMINFPAQKADKNIKGITANKCRICICIIDCKGVDNLI